MTDYEGPTDVSPRQKGWDSFTAAAGLPRTDVETGRPFARLSLRDRLRWSRWWLPAVGTFCFLLRAGTFAFGAAAIAREVYGHASRPVVLVDSVGGGSSSRDVSGPHAAAGEDLMGRMVLTEAQKKAAERRKKIWTACRWPHEILSPPREAAITAVIRRWQPWIASAAAHLAQGRRDVAAEMEQRSRIALWQWGAEAVSKMPEPYLGTALQNEMRKVRREEKQARVMDGREILSLELPVRRTRKID